MSIHTVEGYTVLTTNQHAGDLAIPTKALNTWLIRRPGFEPCQEPGLADACGPGEATSMSRAPSTDAYDAARAHPAAPSAKDVAAQLPVPSAEVADRLLGLLFTYERTRATDDEAA